MKFITIPKESVLCELALGNEVFLIDRYNGCIENVKDIDTVTLACTIKGDGEETQYEFYKKVIVR